MLWGEYYYVNSQAEHLGQPDRRLHRGRPGFLLGGDYTFYGRYVGFDARDDRVPLSSLYYSRYIDGGPSPAAPTCVVWRDNRRADAPTCTCGTSPTWAPLGEMQLVFFDEEENPMEILKSNAFPLATQKVHMGSTELPAPHPFGWLMLDLWHERLHPRPGLGEHHHDAPTAASAWGTRRCGRMIFVILGRKDSILLPLPLSRSSEKPAL